MNVRTNLCMYVFSYVTPYKTAVLCFFVVVLSNTR